MERGVDRRTAPEWASLFRGALVGIAITDGPDDHYLYVNDEFARITGRPAASFIGRPVADVRVTPRAEEFVAGAKRIRETGTGIKRAAVSVEIDRGSGLEQLYLDVQFEPLVDANDEVGGLLLVLVDVTERVRAEQRAEGAVSESEARLRRVYEAIGCGLLVRDRDGTIIFANHEASQLFGVPVEALVGSKGATGVTRFTEDGVPMEQDAVPSVTTLREARQLRDVRTRLRRADGTEVWCRVDAVPVVGTDGTAEYVVTSIIDITDRPRAEERLALRARQQTAVAELGRFSLAANDLDALFGETARTVNGLLGAEACRIIEHSPSERRISVRAGTRLAPGTAGEGIPDAARGLQAGDNLAPRDGVRSKHTADDNPVPVYRAN